MLKKLRIRFVFATILSLVIVLTVITGTINILNYVSVVSDADKNIQRILDNTDSPPLKPNDDKPIDIGRPDKKDQFSMGDELESRYFTISFSDGKYDLLDTKNISFINENQAILLAQTVMEGVKEKGFIYNYRFLVYQDNSITEIIFLDCMKSLEAVRTFVILSIAISIIGVIAVFILIYVISARIVSPLIEIHEKQKQFITNAGHDIKTPITIINADAELIEIETGGSEWLSDIRKQTERMTSLTNDLIYLARMEESESVPHTDFPISEVVEDTLISFAAPAKTKGLIIDSSISPALYYRGDENSIRKLLSLLIDNAVKYSSSGERISVTLKKTSRNVYISVSNPAPNLTDESTKHMFDRFYRSDTSRSSQGGFGIGLSVAAAIVYSHKGKITAKKDNDLLVIEVTLS